MLLLECPCIPACFISTFLYSWTASAKLLSLMLFLSFLFLVKSVVPCSWIVQHPHKRLSSIYQNMGIPTHNINVYMHHIAAASVSMSTISHFTAPNIIRNTQFWLVYFYRAFLWFWRRIFDQLSYTPIIL